MSEHTTYTVRWYTGYSSGWLLTPEQTAALQPTGITWYDRSIGETIPSAVAKALTNNPNAWAGGLMDGVLTFTQEDVDRVAEMVRQTAERRAAQRAQVEMVRCDCGHTVARNLVMSTSRGTSCPDCYDRMSD